MTRFHICRTCNNCDDDGNELCPLDGAFRAACVIHHKRTCTEEYFDRHFSHSEGLWRSKGRNHRAAIKDRGSAWQGDGICRDEDDQDWFVEIDDVLAFVRQHGRCVIGPWSRNREIMSIEICDGYRE